MFARLREQLNLVEVAEEVLSIPFKAIGENTYAPEDESCPFCGHKDCFRIKSEEADSFYKCFSCDETGDVTAFTAKVKSLTNVEAARWLAKKYEIQLPSDYTPVQEAFNLAAQYYHTKLTSGRACSALAGLTPLEYQQQRRKHTTESLTTFEIGWSDGGLVPYLLETGVDPAILAETGLINKKGKDFLPTHSFIYPHKVRGRVSHFTFKDPLKQVEYQLPNKHKLNGHMFYNSDSIKKDGPVIIVEGENDAISVSEAGWGSGILCCNGSISGAQLEWIALNLESRDVITIFDTDAAGDKYREKLGKLKPKFNSLVQVKLGGEVKDIDEYLKADGDLAAAIQEGKSSIEEEDSAQEEQAEASDIVVDRGGYYKVRYKDGESFRVKISNFTIELLNIFVRNGEREREIVIIREDGKRSSPVMIYSEAKVSLKPFKTLVANAVDGSFYGREEDMASMWEYVYKSTKETIVHLPEAVGRVSEFGGWLFGDCFISDVGALYLPDENGVIWIQNKSVGLRAISMETQGVGTSRDPSIPRIYTGADKEYREGILKEYLENLAVNLGKTGDAINMTAWCWASVYSDEIFDAIGHFPFLYFWGKGGRGKTTIFRWMLSMFDLEAPGRTVADQLNSGVAFSRKLSYYSSLPMFIDEVKQDASIKERYGTFRAWYNRGARTVSAKDGFGVKSQPVRSTIMFGGEDQFADDSTRNRCIHIRIPKFGRDEIVSFAKVESIKSELINIGFGWIVGYSDMPISEVISEIKATDSILRKNGTPSRTSLNWAIIAFFASRLAAKYFPDFNYMEYLFHVTKEDLTRQAEDDKNNEFWSVIEGLQIGDHPKISGDHIRREGTTLHVWFAEIFRLAEREDLRNRDSFSKRAILESLKEEDYFIREDRVKMGVNETVRRVISLDLTKAPEVLKSIGEFVE